MANYILGRLLWLIPLLLAISLFTFLLMHMVEGGPWDEERKVSPSVVESLNRKYGLDKPIWQQYGLFLANAVQGDLGVSFQRQDRPVTEILVSGFKVTAVLGFMALAVATLAGVSLGVLSAVKRDSFIDHFSVLLASSGSAVPGFVLGVFLIYIFAVQLHWLPSFGWDLRNGLVPGWLPDWRQLVLPVITLSVLPTAYLARITRSSMLEVLKQDYVRTARAKGLPETRVLMQHSLRNASIPILSLIGPIAAGLITGSFIVEQMFSIPGTGRLFVQSVNARDYGMIMGSTLFYAAVIAIANLAVDVAYSLVDPRIRYR